ncbi:hypothetical protein XENOCAPTIV_021398, partial [Xenoophorus captivus]
VHQHQLEHRDLSPSNSTDQMKAKTDEDCGGAESSRNPGNVKRAEWPSKGWPPRLTQGTLFQYFPALRDGGEPGTEERPS